MLVQGCFGSQQVFQAEVIRNPIDGSLDIWPENSNRTFAAMGTTRCRTGMTPAKPGSEKWTAQGDQNFAYLDLFGQAG